MPNFPRTDLAVEAEAIHRSAAAVTELPGVRAEETERRGFAVTEVHVLDVAGENTLCKPIGDYYTLALDPLLRREDDAFENAAQTLAELLRGVLPLMPDASVLVVGLGNRAITPDAVGPDAIDSVMVTRHLREQLPEHFGQFRSVAALAAGVLGTTGVESADMIRALADHLRPDAIIAVDALAARCRDRLCATVQLGDTGLIPGSGVGNHRKAINARTLGIPVVAVGVPTVIAAGLLGAGGHEDDPLFLTPRDIDEKVRELGRLIGYGISLGLQEGLSVEDVTGLLG